MNLRLSNPARLFAVAVMLTGLLLAGTTIASAQNAGYDLLQTGSGASVDLSSLGMGVVALKGVPIQSSTGNTDTIMHRTANMPPGGGNVPVSVYALFLKNSGSVSYMGTPADVYITINNSGGAISSSVLPQPDTLSSSGGNLTMRTDGTFDSSITMNADVIIVPAGGSPSGSTLAHGAAPSISLTSTNSTWSTTPPAGYPSSSTYPSGGTYPRPVHRGPHPVVPSTCGTTTAQPGTPVSPAQPTGTGAVKTSPAPSGQQNSTFVLQQDCATIATTL
jgi:hypothetical protein